MENLNTILLAEDNPDDVFFTQLAFQKANIVNPLIVVRDGEELIAYLKGERHFSDRNTFPLPILLLLDLNLPKINGFEVLEWVKDRAEFEYLTVAILADFLEGDPYVERAFKFGASSYLNKPARPEELFALVQRLHVPGKIVYEQRELQEAA